MPTTKAKLTKEQIETKIKSAQERVKSREETREAARNFKKRRIQAVNAKLEELDVSMMYFKRIVDTRIIAAGIRLKKLSLSQQYSIDVVFTACSPKDRFSKAEARKIILERADLSFNQMQPNKWCISTMVPMQDLESLKGLSRFIFEMIRFKVNSNKSAYPKHVIKLLNSY